MDCLAFYAREELVLRSFRLVRDDSDGPLIQNYP
jgi:hypothetical protein